MGIKQSILLWICDVPKHLRELCSVLRSVKRCVCLEEMGNCLQHQEYEKKSDVWFSGLTRCLVELVC